MDPKKLTDNGINPFTNSTGQRYLKGLFFETTGSDKSSVIYTLKDKDHMGYPSLFRLYLEAGDITEYRFAQENLDGIEHWDMLCATSWFQDYVQKWRRELSLKIRSEALARILLKAKDTDSRDSFAVNRFLLEEGWKPKEKVGRTTKEKIKQEAQKLVVDTTAYEDDYQRIILQKELN